MWVKKGRLPGGSVGNWLRGTEGLQRRPRAPTAHLSCCRPPISEATVGKGKRTAFRVGPRCLPYRQYDPQVSPHLRASFFPSKWGAGSYLTGLPRGGLAVEAQVCSWDSEQLLAQPSVPASTTLESGPLSVSTSNGDQASNTNCGASTQYLSHEETVMDTGPCQDGLTAQVLQGQQQSLQGLLSGTEPPGPRSRPWGQPASCD